MRRFFAVVLLVVGILFLVIGTWAIVDGLGDEDGARGTADSFYGTLVDIIGCSFCITAWLLGRKPKK